MRHRPEVTDIGWGIAKMAVLAAVLITLAGFSMLSHVFSSSRAGRIACVSNQRSMQQALVYYQMEKGAECPNSMEELREFYADPPKNFGKCPADVKALYTYDPKTGKVCCPNPAHGLLL